MADLASGMIHVGIDPGASGAIVMLDGDEATVLRASHDYHAGNPHSMVRVLAPLVGRPCVVMLERQHPIKGQGLGSTATTMEAYGCWQGVLAGLGLDYHTMMAVEWRPLAGIATGTKGPKGGTIAAVQARLPHIDLTPGRTRRPHDGIADAAGLALAARALAAALA